MWVQDSSIARMGMTFQGRGSIPLEEMFMCFMFLNLVYLCVSHLSQNVNIATHLANKSTTCLKHLKPILVPS